MWIADHPQHCEGAATIGPELVETVPSFYAVLIALGGGRWPPAWVILNEASRHRNSTRWAIAPVLGRRQGEVLGFRHKQTQDAERTAARPLWKEGGWVFTRPTGEPLNPNTDSTSGRSFYGRRRYRTGRPHDAGDTAATALLLLGVPERAVTAEHAGTT